MKRQIIQTEIWSSWNVEKSGNVRKTQLIFAYVYTCNTSFNLTEFMVPVFFPFYTFKKDVAQFNATFLNINGRYLTWNSHDLKFLIVPDIILILFARYGNNNIILHVCAPRRLMTFRSNWTFFFIAFYRRLITILLPINFSHNYGHIFAKK